MKELFDKVSSECSKIVTRSYSTSFTLGIKFLAKKFHDPIYSIYGFVRCADEIVDSFHQYDKRKLLNKFREDAYEAINCRISLNPILNNFQRTVNDYQIDMELIDTFLDSMEIDLMKNSHQPESYQKYIFGSAEVVGLMCLKVFCEHNEKLYDSLKESARNLGAAFQKVNFLRDIKSDKELLGRVYFPGVDFYSFRPEDKTQIENEIEKDFAEALKGIKRLPHSSRAGIYLAYYYYNTLFQKIKSLSPERIVVERIRVSNPKKIGLMINSMIKYRLNLL